MMTGSRLRMNQICSITVTGKELPIIANYCLTEELPWPQDDVDNSNLSKAYKDTPLSSLDVSITGGHGYIDEAEYNQGGATAGEMIDKLQIDGGELKMGARDWRCMTNMVRWNNGTKNNTESVREMVCWEKTFSAQGVHFVVLVFLYTN